MPDEPLLATVDELKDYLNYRADVAPVGEEQVLEMLLGHASDVFNRVRQFYPTSGTETVDLNGASLVTRVPDVRSLTSAAVDGTALGSSTYKLRGRRGEPFTVMYLTRGGSPCVFGDELVLTGEFGFEQVPRDVHTQVLVLAARDYYERQSRHADARQDPDGGAISYFRQLPLSVKNVRDAYRVRSLAI